MPAPLKIKLSEENLKTLQELRQASNKVVPQRTKDRAHMLILNAQGRKVADIATIFSCSEHTVRATINRWKKNGLASLWDAPGRGAKAKITQEDWVYLEKYLKSSSKSYTSKQLAQKLAEDRQTEVSISTVQRIINKMREREKESS